MITQQPLTADRPEAQSPSWGRFAGIVALYALVGPFIGALGVNILFTIMAIAGEVARGNFDDLGRLLVGGMVIGMIFSTILAYALGSVSAIAVGLAVAVGDRREGAISLRRALVAAFVFWLATTAIIVFAPPDGRVQWISAMLVAHLFAAAVCTWVARRIFR